MPRQSREGLVVGLLGMLALLAFVLWLKGPGTGWRGSGSAPVVGADPDLPFAVADCGSRLFDDRPALAVVLTQPVDARQDLGERLRVTDLGPAPGERGLHASKPSEAGAEEGAGDVDRVLRGSWTVGENPRIVYFPYVQPQRRLRIDVDASLRSVDGRPLAASVDCQVASEAMPPTFHFASRGVVLPAGQNGGLPVVTVNVPSVDIEFLRIEPSALPRFLERVAGARRPVARPVDDEMSAEDESEADAGLSPQRLQGAVSGWQLDELKDAARSVHRGRWLTDERADRRQVSFIDVESVRELQEPGVYVAVMSQPGRYRHEYQVTYFYVSDIGLHLRRYARGAQAFVTSLRSGEALGDVELELLDDTARSVGRARSDAEGRAAFDSVPDSARVLLARRGTRELSVVTLSEPALDLSEFDVGGHPSRAIELFAYAGRDLYRPGERFVVPVLARAADGRVTDPLPIDTVLKRPDGRAVRQTSWPVNAERPGYFEPRVDLPADAPTGRWNLELRQDPAAREPDAVWSFQVEEFLPERMKLALSHEAPVLGPDDAFDVEVQGDYLFGAPAAGNRLMASVASERLRFALPKAWPGFLFGDVDDDRRKGREEVEEQTLDEQGRATVTLPTRPGAGTGDAMRSPMLLRGSFSLLETGGRPVVRSIERPLWPAPQLLALRPLFDRDVAAEDAPAAFELIRVDAEGRFVALPAATPATLRLYREERQYHWRHDDQKGWHSGYVDLDELVETRRPALREREQVSMPVRFGRYRLEVDDPVTGLTLRYRFYAGWAAQDAEAIGNRPDRVRIEAGGLPLRADSRVLRATIVPPHDGEALVTVEADRLLWSRRIKVAATGTPIEIPVDADWGRHDLYLGVTAFRPGSQGAKVTPSRAVGLLHLPLDRRERRLAVAIEAPAKVLPERRMTVKLRVDGAQSAPRAFVTLSAVDVGILQITRFPTPDPVDRFFGKHRYAAELNDLYGRLIEKMDGRAARLRYGGDSSARDTRSLPKKVQLVDLFSGPVALDARGEAQVAVDVPDFNGTLRLMAVAFAADRFGSADAEVVSAAPIVAELAMPRFVSPGDRATLALDLTNLSGAAQDLRVVLDADASLRLDESSWQLTLADRQRRTLRLPVEAVGAAGLARLRLSLDARPAAGSAGTTGAGPIAIRREAFLQVQPSTPPQREARFVRIEAGARIALDAPLLPSLFADTVTANLALSDRPPLNLRPIVQGLLTYPYGCTEQTTSSAYPWVLLDGPTATSLGLPVLADEARRAAVETALGRLAGGQRQGGGWSLWGDGGVDLWLSAYVQGFLLDAREAGFSVGPALVQRGREHLLQQLQQAPNRFPEWPSSLQAALVAAASALESGEAASAVTGTAPAPAGGTPATSAVGPVPAASPPGVDTGAAAAPGARSGDRPPLDARDLELLRDSHQRFAELAQAGYVLAREQQAPLSALRALHDRFRDRARSPLPLVHLSIALRLMGDLPRAEAALEDAMRRPYGITAAFAPNRLPGSGVDEWLGDYGSVVRDLAMSHALLMRHGVGHARRDQLLLDVARRAASRRYLSTQERLALLLAGRHAGLGAAQSPDGWQARLAAGGQDEALSSRLPMQRSLEPTAWRAGSVPMLDNVGRTPLYAQLEIAGHPRQPPAPRRDVIELERRWFDLQGRPWTGREPRVGEMMVVELRARARQRLDDALVVDRIPAGFEVENLNLSQGPKASEFIVNGVNVGEAMADPRIRHREFRDDRFVAAARLDRDWLPLYYLVRVVSPGRFVVPAPFAEDMYRPELYGLGEPGAAVTIVDPGSQP